MILLLYANDKIRKRREGSTRLNERFISVTKEDFILFKHSHTNELILIRFFLEYLEWLSKIQEQYPKNQFSVPPLVKVKEQVG
jgi:hypothetical protein